MTAHEVQNTLDFWTILQGPIMAQDAAIASTMPVAAHPRKVLRSGNESV